MRRKLVVGAAQTGPVITEDPEAMLPAAMAMMEQAASRVGQEGIRHHLGRSMVVDPVPAARRKTCWSRNSKSIACVATAGKFRDRVTAALIYMTRSSGDLVLVRGDGEPE